MMNPADRQTNLAKSGQEHGISYKHATILFLTIRPCSCNLASNPLWQMNEV